MGGVGVGMSNAPEVDEIYFLQDGERKYAADTHADTQTHAQTRRHADTQAGRQAGRQVDRQAHRHTP